MSGQRSERRYEFAAVEEYAGRILEPEWTDSRGIVRTVGLKTVCRVLGIPERQAYRWRQQGLTVDQADELACRLGVHPNRLWPSWFDDGLSPMDDLFVNGGGWRADWEWRHAS